MRACALPVYPKTAFIRITSMCNHYVHQSLLPLSNVYIARALLPTHHIIWPSNFQQVRSLFGAKLNATRQDLLSTTNIAYERSLPAPSSVHLRTGQAYLRTDFFTNQSSHLKLVLVSKLSELERSQGLHLSGTFQFVLDPFSVHSGHLGHLLHPNVTFNAQIGWQSVYNLWLTQASQPQIVELQRISENKPFRWVQKRHWKDSQESLWPRWPALCPPGLILWVQIAPSLMHCKHIRHQ